MNKTKLLLIEDDESAAEWIIDYFEECDFDIDTFSTVSDAASHILFNQYDLILLDLSLSDFEGFEILKFINKNRLSIPVIIISAYSDKSYKLKAFNLGAVDYMVKPIDLEELEARIWVHLKDTTQILIKKDKKDFEIKDDVIIFNNNQLSLTKIEFEILSYLIENKNQIVQRDTLTNALSAISSHRSLDYHIRNLRKKLDDNGTNPKYLFTEYGIGYKLVF
jgi:DNA-binding response OmpR family regulator